MIRSLLNKLTTVFTKKKSKAIPFADYSREAVKDLPDQEQEKPPAAAKKEWPTRKKPAVRDVPKERKPSADNDSRRKPWEPSDFDVPPVEGKLRFHDLDLPVQILHAIADLNFQYCTPVQAGILPDALKGKDALGKAQTGTGKSAAFLITILNHMIRKPIKGGPPKGKPRALILAPTRELVLQIEKDALSLSKHTPFKIISVFGGIGYDKQMRALKEQSFDVVVATPGRLIDFKNKKLIHLDKVEILVLDEADRMLDMGFIPDVRKIVYSTPHKNERQTFFYSATFTPEVTRLAEQWTNDPCKVEIEPDHVAADSVKQMMYITTSAEKFPLLYNLIKRDKLERVLVFTNRRDQARDLAKKMSGYDIETALISGEVHQNKRLRALESFRSGKKCVLVATDVAARGLHIEDISHVINYNLPQDPESYVHRIGRTGRAGSKGISVSFACEDDSFHIPDIEAFLGNNLVCEHPDDELLIPPPEPVRKPDEPKSDRKPVRRQRKPRSVNGSAKDRGSSSHSNGNGTEKDKEKPAGDAPKRRRRRRPSGGKRNGQSTKPKADQPPSSDS